MQRINDTAVEFAEGIAVVHDFGQSRRAFGRLAEAATTSPRRSGRSSARSTPRAVSELALSPAIGGAVTVIGAARFVTTRSTHGVDGLQSRQL
jgi:hypothetical protein